MEPGSARSGGGPWGRTGSADPRTAFAGLREALRRFRTLVSIGIFVAVLTLAANGWAAVWKWTAPSQDVPGLWIESGLSLAVTILLGLATAILVLIALVVVVLGFLAWRRASRQLVAASAGSGTPLEREARAAFDDSKAAVRWVVLAVAAAIALGIVLGIVDAVLWAVGRPFLPGALGSAVVGLGAGAVLVRAYHHGSRQFVTSLRGWVAPTAGARLATGRAWILAGAVLGVFAALSAFAWPIEVLAIVSGAFVLVGTNTILAEYDGWLNQGFAPPPPTGFSLPRSVP
jgi:hypothetical protein